MTKVTGNREHKDRLFISIFQKKEDLLSLYNAVNDSNYEDPEAKFMILSEYDEERHMKQTYEEGRERGRAEGKNQINILNQILIDQKRLEDLKRSIADPEFQQKLLEELVQQHESL